MLIAGLALIIVLLVVGTPIWVVIGLPSAIFILISGVPETLIIQRMFAGMDEFIFIAIPLFLLAGEIMNIAGLTERLLNFANILFGRMRANLAMISLFLSGVVSGISGSALADASAVGGLLIPKMKENGYSAGFASAVVAAGSIVGPVIPPSVTFILYAVLTGTSVSDLFLAGVVPGILIIALLMVTVQWMAYRGKLPGRSTIVVNQSKKQVMTSALPVLLLPVLIVGGIRGGFYTPTEGAAWAVVYSLILGLIYRRVNGKAMFKGLLQVSQGLGEILLMIASASLLSWILVAQQIPDAIGEAILSVTQDKLLILIVMNLVLLLIGCILENIPAMIVFVPILLPIANTVGIDPIHLGVIINVNLMIGAIHPPVGIVLFVTSRIAKVRLEEASMALIPLILSVLVSLVLITYIPGLSLWLPQLFK
ncbi:MAG: TRAP transporter large permease [Comamonadaceae bacterium]|nr:MAG: TRAP transporter large permease [Comamonadaceae bacterium]